MSEVNLVIGSKRLSSWSLRPWLFLQHHGVSFRETVVELDRPTTRSEILKHSPSGKVPVLKVGDLLVWDSLAICDFAAEWFALPQAWPMMPAARAMARSAVAEMHAGFPDLRRELPFDCGRRHGPVAMSDKAQADILRIRLLWRTARNKFGAKGPWLFGHFGIADAMFAPVALRFQQYGVTLDGPEHDYYEAVIEHHAVEAWVESVSYEMGGKPVPPQRPVKSFLDTQEIPVRETDEETRPSAPIGIKSVIIPP